MTMTRLGIDYVMFILVFITSIHVMSSFTNVRLNQDLGVLRKPTFQGDIGPGLIQMMRNVFRKVVNESLVNERIEKFKAKQRQKKIRQQSNLERMIGTSILTQNDFLQTDLGSEFFY